EPMLDHVQFTRCSGARWIRLTNEDESPGVKRQVIGAHYIVTKHGIEQGACGGRVETSAERHVHVHELHESVSRCLGRRKKRQFSAVPGPRRAGAAGRRYLALAAKGGEGLYEHFVLACFVGHVREPSTVRGNFRHPFVETRRQQRMPLGALGEREK